MSFQARSSQNVSPPTTSRKLALRTHPLIFGVVVFLASELMFFGGLLAAYYNLKTINAVWPPPDVRLDLGESTIGTILLALSSISMLFATRNIAQHRMLHARLWLGSTIILGTAFEFITAHGWRNATFSIHSHAYGTTFYALTGFHFAHVLVGIIILMLLFFGLDATAFERDKRAGVEAIGYYWHFVFGVWILIWGTIYLVR